MSSQDRIEQGTRDWFEMVGTLMCEAATRYGLSTDLDLSLVERYTDGVEWADGLVQGIGFELRAGRPSFRVGVSRDERGDVTVEISAAAARALNLLSSADAAYKAERDKFLATGEMKVTGDPSSMGGWLDAVHGPIVARTR